MVFRRSARRRVALELGLATALVYPGTAAAIVIEGPEDLPDELPSLVAGKPVQESVASVIGYICPPTTPPIEEDLQTLCNGVVGNALEAGEGPAPEATMAIEQASPEQIAAQGTAEVNTTVTQIAAIQSRLSALRGGASGLSLAGLSLYQDGQKIRGEDLEQLLPAQLRGGGAASDDFSRLGIFFSGKFGQGDRDTTSREAGYDLDFYGLTLGADYRFTDSFILGGALGYNDSKADFDGDRGKVDTDGYSLMGYGTYYPNDNLYVDFMAYYGQNDYTTKRHVSYDLNAPLQQEVDVTLKSKNDSDRYGFAVGAGYSFFRDAWELQPFGQLAYSHADFDDMTESANVDNLGPGWAMKIDDSDIDSLTTSLGLQVSRPVSQSWGVLIPLAQAAWLHEFKDDSRTIQARFIQAPNFANDPNAVIKITTDSPDRNYGTVGLGLSAIFAQGSSGFVLVESLVGHKYMDEYQISLGFRMEL